MRNVFVPRRSTLAASLLLLVAPLACAKKEAAPELSAAAAAGAAPVAKAAPAADPGLTVPEGASVSLLEPNDTAVYVVGDGKEKANIHVRFGLSGMEARPAGEIVPGTGHHHLIINAEGTEFGQPVPKTETSIHYGQGQTEADIELTPGEYTLTAQFANGAHLSYGEKMRASVKIRVEKPVPAVDPDAAPTAPVPAPGDLAPGVPAVDPAAKTPPSSEPPPPGALPPVGVVVPAPVPAVPAPGAAAPNPAPAAAGK